MQVYEKGPLEYVLMMIRFDEYNLYLQNEAYSSNSSRRMV